MSPRPPLDPAARPAIELGQGVWQFAARVAHWPDGDTVHVRTLVDTGFSGMHSEYVELRIGGIDCNETNDRDPVKRAAGIAARDYVRAQWPVETLVLVTTEYDRSFARYIANVEAGDVDIADALIAAGHAREAT